MKIVKKTFKFLWEKMKKGLVFYEKLTSKLYKFNNSKYQWLLMLFLLILFLMIWIWCILLLFYLSTFFFMLLVVAPITLAFGMLMDELAEHLKMK